jgi:hypothetical protein
MPRHGGRIFAENGLPLVVPLLKAYTFAPAEVNGRPDFHPMVPFFWAGLQAETVNIAHSGAACKAGDATAGELPDLATDEHGLKMICVSSVFIRG